MSCASKAILASVVLTLISACHNHKKPDPSEKAEAIVNKHIVEVNKIVTDDESDEIDSWIKRHNWDMKQSPTGLRYGIYDQKPSGKQPSGSSVVRIRFSTKLLDGTVCYASESNRVRIFTLGRGELCNGMEEGLKMMKNGEKARFVIPSHLAYGFTGDGAEIPVKSVLVCEVELVDVIKK